MRAIAEEWFPLKAQFAVNCNHSKKKVNQKGISDCKIQFFEFAIRECGGGLRNVLVVVVASA